MSALDAPYDSTANTFSVDDVMEQQRRAAQTKILQDAQQKQMQDAQAAAALPADAASWAQNPDYQGKSWSDVSKSNPEVPAHFGIDIYGNSSASAPKAWNDAQTAQTGIVTGQPLAPITPAMAMKAATAGFQPIPGESATELETRMANQKAPVKYDDLDPALQAQVDQIAQYKKPYPGTRGGLPPAQRAQVLGALAERYPDYNTQEFASRQAARNGFAEGPEAKSITSANTVIGHLDKLNDAVDQLGNTNTLPGILNPIRNDVGNVVSADKQAKLSKLNSVADAVASEMAKVFTGAAPAMQTIREWRSNFDANASPQAQKAAIQSAVELLGSRMQAMQDQWEHGVKGERDIPFVNKQSRGILTKLGVNPDVLEPGTTAKVPQPQVEKSISQPQKPQQVRQNGVIYTLGTDGEYR